MALGSSRNHNVTTGITTFLGTVESVLISSASAIEERLTMLGYLIVVEF